MEFVRTASENISAHNSESSRRIEAVEKSVNELYRKANRPGGFGSAREDDNELKDAIDYCKVKHEIDVPKNDGLAPVYTPTPSEIDNALVAKQAMHSLCRKGNSEALPVEHKTSLSAFSFGTNQFILAPELSNRVLSCIHDPTEVVSLMGQASTSGGSLKFFIEFAKTNPPTPPFRCPRGAESKDPFNPAWMAIHQSHCQQAGEERIAREWRERSTRQG